MKKEIQLIKAKTDSASFIIKQLELLEYRLNKIANMKRDMILDDIYSDQDKAKVESDLSIVNSQIEQYEDQLKGL